jgi:hypothetical protein
MNPFKKSKATDLVAAPNVKFWDVEAELDVADIVCIRKGETDVWAIANNKGPTTQYAFLWDFKPFHETSYTDEDMAKLLSIVGEVDGVEQFTISTYSDADCSDRLAQLDEECKGGDPETRFLYESLKNRVKTLADGRLRKNIRYTLSNTYTIDEQEHEASNWQERILFMARKTWLSLQPSDEDEDVDEPLFNTLNNVYEAFQDYDTRVVSRLGVGLPPHDGNKIWHDQWRRVNGDRPDPGLPYYIHVDLDRRIIKVIGRKGAIISEGKNAEGVDVTSKFTLPLTLFDERVPVPSRDTLYLPGRAAPKTTAPYQNKLKSRGEYCTVLGLSDIPDGFDEPKDKYGYIWNQLISVEGISDFEIHTQLMKLPDKYAMDAMTAVTKQTADVAETAKKRGSIDKKAEITAEDGEDAMRMIIKGDGPVYMGVAIVLYATSEERLKAAVRKVSARFTAPAKVYREPNYAWKMWMQCSPFRMDPIFTSSDYTVIRNDYRQKPNISASLALLPGIGIRDHFKDGVEFISRKGSVPVHIGFEDDYGNATHGHIYGKSGSGKSVISSRFILAAWARGFVITLVDLPDGVSGGSYSFLVKFLGGVEVKTGETRGNILEHVDVRNVPAEKRGERLSLFRKSCVMALQSLVLDNLPSTQDIPLTQVQGILPRALNQFYDDPDIRSRIDAALNSSPGEPAWEAWPTLKHFMNFLTPERLDQDHDKTVQQAIKFVRSRIRYWLESPLAKTIAEPSDYDFRKSRLVLFSLEKMSGDEEAAVLGLVAQQAAERRSLGAADSLFYVDECSQMLKFPSLARYIGQDFATGRKKDKRILIATQDPNSVDKCAAAAEILQNRNYTLIGKIGNDSVPHFNRILRISEEDLCKNVGTAPNRKQRCTPWLIDIDGATTHVYFYASDIPLAAVLTNGGEVRMRNHHMKNEPNKYLGLAKASAEALNRNLNMISYKDWALSEAEIAEQTGATLVEVQ